MTEHAHGRVADDGTVFVRRPDGEEIAVGQWAAGAPAEGLAFFERKYDGLKAEAAPETVNAMLFLAQEGYFDSTLCHRLTTEGIKVLQCGDPTATGTGGPGFTIPDENLPEEGDTNYPAGTVAMANAGPGTSGSQFFLVYEDTTLPPNYTIWGQVSSGLDIVEQVAGAGVAGGGADGAPAAPIGIEAATVSQAQG